MSTPRLHRRSGLAMIAVLLVLMALFVLCAPFLITVRNADQASADAAERATERITLDLAGRHAEARLAGSHPGLDATPYFDDAEELAVEARFPEGFLSANDPTRPMWDVQALDVAGKIDLASASPHVLANLIGGAARLTSALPAEGGALELSDASGFADEGVVYVDQELVAYTRREGNTLSGLTRGLLHEAGADPGAKCGPEAAAAHEVGAYVIDQRAFGLCEWRLAGGDVRPYDGIESLRSAKDAMLGPGLGREAFLALESQASPFGHVRAGARWQRAVRLVADVGGAPEYGCELIVDDLRWFNAGATVRLDDGKNREVALVRRVEEGKVYLLRPLSFPFQGGSTVVEVLARAPVNVNSASPAVLSALWTNLKLRGRSARLTAGEAKELVEVVLASRPFTGFEDFLRRVVLPAGGLDELPPDAPVPETLERLAREAKVGSDGTKSVPGFLDPEDAVALYKCALNANDNELEFATMPLSFLSRDVYQLEARASIPAESGVERAHGVRTTVEMVVPQRELLSIWTRQEDFDEAPRLDTAAAAWMTGPVPTSRFDPRYGFTHSERWPTRARAQLGPDDTQPWGGELLDEGGDPHLFAARDDDAGWAQLLPMREDERARRADWALHFDDETKRLEGRFLPDAPVPFDPARARWVGSGGLLQGLSFSMWLQPRQLEDGAQLFDLAGAIDDLDRVSLLVEQGELVLRVLDGSGDHTDTSFEERAEVRYPLQGQGPGLPLDTWSHVSLSVEGNRPDQLELLVDGRRATSHPGLTRLTSGLTGESDEIPVESTEGFPDRCVLRIGDELIEATKDGAKSFRARFQSVGENAGFGGRLAREEYAGVEPNELNQALFKDTNHPAGTSVMLYGYSLPIVSNVPAVEGRLRDELGLFAVARLDGIVVSGSSKQQSAMPPIQVQGTFGPFTVGWGIDGSGRGLEGLELQPADPNRSLEDTMAAFNSGGGYAAILQVIFTNGSQGQLATDLFNTRIGGVEVVRYRGYSGRTLHITERGDQVKLANLAGSGVDPSVKGRGAFLVAYRTDTGDADWDVHATQLSFQTMVIPISVPVGASSSSFGFEPGQPGRSAFAQLTHLGGEAHLTEWVRYDEISTDGQLVRDTSTALMNALFGATGGRREEQPTQPRPGSGGGGGGGAGPGAPGGGGAGPGRPGGGSTSALVLAPSAPRATRPVPAQVSAARGSYWDYTIGEREDHDFLVARAVASNFQFRGVLGTFQHPHPAGTGVLPVFRTYQRDETLGWPGRFDAVTFLSDAPEQPGFQGVIQHAHRPREFTVWAYQDGTELAPAESGEPVAAPQSGFDVTLTHVALQGPLAVPFAAVPVGSDAAPKDSRLLTRMTLFPSGELPRLVTAGKLGGSARAGGVVPSTLVDEALFFPSFVRGAAAEPAQFVLAQPLGEGDGSAVASVNTLRTTLGDFVDPTYAGVLGSLPPHGGLLRVGDEVLAYEGYDAGTFTFTLPQAGRGLLGSEPGPHRAGEALTFLGSLPCGILGVSVGADDALLPLLELPPGFPAAGTVWIDGELVHYTRVEGPVLLMPRASTVPGRRDEKGPGLFRGRYGTPRAAHSVGTPVILFPFRYWDRWSELADAPELAYYQLSLDQPDAFWRRAFWRQSEPGQAGPELYVLQRTNPETPWDAPPDELDPATHRPNGLRLLSPRKLSGEGETIGVQADRVEWRVFVRHQPGSFDARTGAAHGWKASPRLELFGVEYLGPSRTFSRIER